MIYVREKYDSYMDYRYIENVYEIDNDDIEEEYKQHIQSLADNIGVIINPHWLNLMNWTNHHPHLTKTEYNRLHKQWNKILKNNPLSKYILDNGGKILTYKQTQF